MCARPLLITVDLKGIVSVSFRCPARTVGFSETRLYLCIYNQPSWTMPSATSWLGGSTRGLQPGGHVSLQPASILQAQAPLNLSVMTYHSLERTQADPHACPSIYSHSMPASPIELKNSLPDQDLNPGGPESSARQTSRHCDLFIGLAHWVTEIDCYYDSITIAKKLSEMRH